MFGPWNVKETWLWMNPRLNLHYGDVIMGAIAYQITRLTIVYSTVYSDADQKKHQGSASLAFVRGNHGGPVNFPHKWPVTRKMFPFDDVIMYLLKVKKYLIRKNSKRDISYAIINEATVRFCLLNCRKYVIVNDLKPRSELSSEKYRIVNAAMGKSTPWKLKICYMLWSMLPVTAFQRVFPRKLTDRVVTGQHWS